MKLTLLLVACATVASCSSAPDVLDDNVEGVYAQARNQACLIEAQRNLKFGQFAESLATFQRWHGPMNDPVAHLTLARIYLGMGDRDGAKAALEAAADLVPDSAPLQALLARFELPLISPALPSDAEIAATPASAPKGFVTLE